MLKRVVFLGPPGAGKGTLAQRVHAEMGVPHIATGDLVRAEIKAATPLGREIQATVEAGALVEDAVITRLMRARLLKPDARKGFIVDGYPRTVAQARALSALLEEADTPLEAVVYFEVGEDEVVKRLSGRRQCRACGRVFHVANAPPRKEGVCDACGGRLYQRRDDRPETVRRRLKVYARQTLPLVRYYEAQGLLKRVEASGSIEENLARLRRVLGVP